MSLRNHPFASFHSEFVSPFNFATHEMEGPFATDPIHRVLQGAGAAQSTAQRGAKFYFMFAVLRALFFMQPNEPFLP